MWKRFQPGEGPSRGLLHDSENVADGLFAALDRSPMLTLSLKPCRCHGRGSPDPAWGS